MEFGLKYTIKIVINDFSTGLCCRRVISGRISYFTVGLSAGQKGLPTPNGRNNIKQLCCAIKEPRNKGIQEFC
jgi:hypothetical protein